MSQAGPPQLLGPDPIAAARRDDGSLSIGDLISAYEAGPKQLRAAVRAAGEDARRSATTGRAETVRSLSRVPYGEEIRPVEAERVGQNHPRLFTPE